MSTNAQQSGNSDGEFEVVQWRSISGTTQTVKGRKKPECGEDEEQPEKVSTDECLVSIAISLERIADALEAANNGGKVAILP